MAQEGTEPEQAEKQQFLLHLSCRPHAPLGTGTTWGGRPALVSVPRSHPLRQGRSSAAEEPETPSCVRKEAWAGLRLPGTLHREQLQGESTCPPPPPSRPPAPTRGLDTASRARPTLGGKSATRPVSLHSPRCPSPQTGLPTETGKSCRRRSLYTHRR